MSWWRALLIVALVLAAFARVGRISDRGARFIDKQVERSLARP